MLSRLLVATDGSEATHRMLECVRQLSAIGGREVLLVHVFNIRDVGGLYLSMKEAVAPKLEQQRKYLEEAGFQAAIEAPAGIPFAEINKLAA